VGKAESGYIPLVIRDTLEDTGQWGQVRVLPGDGTGMEVFVDGRILESNGRELRLQLVVSDATGRAWFNKVYEGEADTRAYKDGLSKPRDPFENVYNTIANDLLTARRALTREQQRFRPWVLLDSLFDSRRPRATNVNISQNTLSRPFTGNLLTPLLPRGRWAL